MNRLIIAALVFAVHGNGQCVQISGRNKEKRGLSDIGYGSEDKLSPGGYMIQPNQGYNADYNTQGYYAGSGGETGVNYGGFGGGYEGKNVLDSEATNGLGLNSNNYLALTQSSQPLQYTGQQPQQPSYVSAYRSSPEQGLSSVYSPGAFTQSYPGKGELDLPNFQGQLPITLGNNHNVGGGFTSGIKGGFGGGYKSNLSGGGFGGLGSLGGLNSFGGGHNLGSRGFFRGYRSLPENPREPRYYSQNQSPTLMKIAYIPTH